MDQDKLERLRQRYAEAKGDDIFDPRFKAVADVLFSESGNRSLPYGGISTFLDAPQTTSLDDLDVALIGIPMDLGVTNRTGARLGPRAVRSIERIGPYHHALDVLPLNVLRYADVGDVPFRSRFSLDDAIEDIYQYFKTIMAAGIMPFSVGGDHSVTYPILKALGETQPVGLVHIDAHCDTSGEYDGSKFHHGGPFRLAVLDGVLDPDRTIQIGIRGNAEFLWEFSYESGMTVIHAEEFAAQGVERIIEKTLGVIGDKPFYVSIDVDGIDPAFTPGTGTPEVGGLAPLDVQRLLYGLAGRPIIGGDVVEVAPQYDATSNTAQVGAQLLFEILSLAALKEKSE